MRWRWPFLNGSAKLELASVPSGTRYDSRFAVTPTSNLIHGDFDLIQRAEWGRPKQVVDTEVGASGDVTSARWLVDNRSEKSVVSSEYCYRFRRRTKYRLARPMAKSESELGSGTVTAA